MQVFRPDPGLCGNCLGAGTGRRTWFTSFMTDAPEHPKPASTGHEGQRLFVIGDSLAGGLGRAVARQAAWFSERGWDVTVAAPADEPDAVEVPRHMPLSMPRTVRSVGEVVRASEQVRRIRKTVRPDIVQCHGARSFAITRMSGGPAPFVTLHGLLETSDDPVGYARLRRIGLGLIPLVARAAFDAEPDGPRGWTFTPHASDRLSTMDRLGPPTSTAPTFLWLGRLDEPKQPQLFVRAIAKLSRSAPGATGIMAGNGALDGEVAELIRDTKAPVELVGHHEAIEPLLGAAWAVSLLSRFEAVPFVLQEAMWAGRAVVASDLPGIRWLFGNAGSLVEDEDEAVSAFLELCDRQVAEKRGADAAQRVRRMVHPDDPWPAYAEAYARTDTTRRSI